MYTPEFPTTDWSDFGVFVRTEIQIFKFQDSGMSGDGIRGLLNLAGASVAAPDKLSEAWANFPEADRAALGNGALERITKVLEDLKYKPNEEFAIFAKDAGELGTQSVLSHLPSNLGMRDLVSFRNFLKLMVTATVAGDQSKLASLTEELESCDELRKLVKNLGAGQPVREMEPSEGPLREAKLAAKMGRFVHFHAPKVEEVIKTKRPLAQTVCSELPRLWAAVLQQRCSMGDVLNWIAQVCLVATDKAIADSIMAEKVASVYGFRTLHEAYQVSKQGETESCGLRNVADVLSRDEIQSIPSASGAAVVRKDLSADRPFYCLEALFNMCTSSYCKHLHGCPFCHTRLDACQSRDGICCPRRSTVGAVVVAPVARRHLADVPFWSPVVALPAAPDLDQNRALTVVELRIGLDGAPAAPVPAAAVLPPALQYSSVVYNGFEKLGCGSLAFEVGGSNLPGYSICFRIDSPWISSGTSSVQPPRSGAVVQQRGLSAEAHVEAALQSTHRLGLPPVVPHGFAFALTAEHTACRGIGRLRLERLALLHQIVKEEAAAQSCLAQEGPVWLKSFASRPTRALGRILRLIGSTDTRVTMETAVGFQDWGSPKPSGVFHRSVQPSTCDINVSLLLEGARYEMKF